MGLNAQIRCVPTNVDERNAILVITVVLPRPPNPRWPCRTAEILKLSSSTSISLIHPKIEFSPLITALVTHYIVYVIHHFGWLVGWLGGLVGVWLVWFDLDGWWLIGWFFWTEDVRPIM